MTLMVQVDLIRGDSQMTTWVDKKLPIQRGSYITLKDIDDKGFWKVEKVYDLEMERADIEINRNWDNNNYDKHDGTPLKNRK